MDNQLQIEGISVCMATYNGGRYIEEQVSSILYQLRSFDELLVSDDGSTDNTMKIIHSFNDSRIKIFNGPGKGNPVDNFEHILNKAKGAYIFLSDQDDIWLPDKITVCLQLLRDYDLVVTDCKIVDESLKVIHPSYYVVKNSGTGIIRNFRKNAYLGACMCFRKELLKIVLPFPKNLPMHDIWIGFAAEFHCKIKFTQHSLVLYRRHSDNATVSPIEKSNNPVWKQIGFRIKMLRNIPRIYYRFILRKPLFVKSRNLSN